MCNHFVPEMTDVLQDIKMLSSHDVCFTKKEFDGGRDCICELESRFWLLGACPGSFGARSGPVCSATPHPLHSATHPGSPRRSPTHHRGTHPPLTHGSPMALTRLPHRSSTCSSSMPRHIQWDFKSVRMPTTNFSPWVRGHFPRGTVLHTPSTICFVLSTIRIIGESCFAVPPPYYQSKLSWCSFTSGISR
jgi:hypothetical protein